MSHVIGMLPLAPPYWANQGSGQGDTYIPRNDVVTAPLNCLRPCFASVVLEFGVLHRVRRRGLGRTDSSRA